MRSLGWIILVVFILLSVGLYAQYKENNNDIVKPTPTTIPIPSLTPTPILTSTPTPTPQKQADAIIGPGETAQVQCDEGDSGRRVVFEKGGFSGNIGLGEQTDIRATVQDEKGQLVGGLVEWKLYDRGTLEIEGCKATFIAPDSIGTAYSTSATINARVVPDTTPTSAPTSAGEGGPVFAGFVATTKVTILSGKKPGCFDPAGVAISINSVSTYRAVQIRVDTPTVVGRVYNGRIATVRDGPGIYEIQIFVDGAFYRSTTSQVKQCQLPAVKF